MIVCRHDVVLASVLVSLSRNTYRLSSVSLHDTFISHLDVSSALVSRLDACAPVVGFVLVWARCSVSGWSTAVEIGCVLGRPTSLCQDKSSVTVIREENAWT